MADTAETIEPREQYSEEPDVHEELIISAREDKKTDATNVINDKKQSCQDEKAALQRKKHEALKSDSAPNIEKEMQTRDNFFLLADFIDELGESSKNLDSWQFKDWLDKHPALYSLDLKHRITEPLIFALAESSEPMHPAPLEALLVFLGLNHVNAGHAWIDHQANNARLNSQNYWRNESLAQSLRTANKNTTMIDRMLFRELEGPINYIRRVFILTFPGLISRICELASKFYDNQHFSFRKHIDHENYLFWMSTSDPGKVSSGRIVGVLIISITAGILFQWLNNAGDEYSGLRLASSIFGIWLAQASIRAAFVRLQSYLSDKPDIYRKHAYTIPLLLISLLISPFDLAMVLGIIPNLAALSQVLKKENNSWRLMPLTCIIAFIILFSKLALALEVTESIQVKLFTIIPAISMGIVVTHDLLLMKIKKLGTYSLHQEWKYLLALSLAAIGLAFLL
ncbi:MAG: hypothetical protein ACREPB_03190 [Arenimonas sp.]